MPTHGHIDLSPLRQAGVGLIEVLVALLIFSTGMMLPPKVLLPGLEKRMRERGV